MCKPIRISVNCISYTGQPLKAIDYLQKAISLDPKCVTAHYNLGNVYKYLEKLSAAIASYQRAIELHPNHSNAYNNLGNIYLKLGELDLAYQCYQQPASLHSPENLTREDNWLLAMHYSNKFSPAKIYRQHQNWGNKYESQLSKRDKTYQNIPNPQRQLKIGYVSGDFKTHSVSYSLEPLLANRDRASFNVTCYANNKYTDAVTARLQKLVDNWRNLADLDDAAVAELIRSDSIDILVDLGGHTFGNRLLVFAHQPAPLQVTYLGYPDTTGLSSIDYRLSDRFADPEAEYIDRATNLANNSAKLALLRQNLRSQMTDSSLTDGKAIASNIERAYRQMWLRYCESRNS